MEEKLNKTINEKELETLKFWQEGQIFEKSLKQPAGAEPLGKFTFYDGPPFATGLPHHGHLLASTIKDVIPRFQTMQGKSVRRVWGWDTHGLPIENLIEKKYKLDSKKDIEEFGLARFNKAAEESVLTYEKEWQEIIPRFGRWVDMQHAYKTMDYNYTESVWWVFKELAKKDLVYEGYKSMHICPRCETTLAQSEVALAYKDLTDISVIAKFALLEEANTFFLAWTTTPWTLPGNVALAVNSEFTYVKVKVKDGENYILAKERVEEVFKKANLAYEIVLEFRGSELVGKKYQPVFNYYENLTLKNKENIYQVVSADFVTLEVGTGIVHIAPAFGEDDLNLALNKNLPIIRHVGMDGRFTKEVLDFANQKVKTNTDNQSADIEIIKYLAHHQTLFAKEKILHSYPTCWRCGTPLLNYAANSWFIKITQLKDKLLAANSQINWVPANVKEGRFGKWLEGARDWAVSRSRYWGAPIPIWKEIDGSEVKVIESLQELAKFNKTQAKNEYYLMRHGESYHNVEAIEECGRDPKNVLTPLGILQVEDAKKKNQVDFDIFVTSPYIRTKMTAEIIAGDKKGEILVREEFREINSGRYNGEAIKKIREDYGEDFLKFDTILGGGESHRQVMERMLQGILKLEKEYQGKKILIVSHGAPIRMAQAGAELLTEEAVIKDERTNEIQLYPKNAEIKKIDLQIVPRDELGRINLHRPYIDEVILVNENGREMKRIPDVFDCWFESGSMPYGQFHYPFENRELFKENFPADFIAEGLDQTRGWFYSLLNLSVGTKNQAAYKNVIANGLLLAKDGEKMSKSKNNYTDPMTLVEKYGADAFRYALLSSQAMYGESVPFLDKNVEEAYKKVIQKLENVLSFYELLKIKENPLALDSNFRDFKNPLDIWILTRLNEILKNTKDSVEKYRLELASRPFEKFIDDLSTWWLRRSRERLRDENREAEIVLQKVLLTFSKVIAPFLPFLAERIYQALNINNLEKKESVHLEAWPETFLEIEERVLGEMEEVRNLVTEALMVRQKHNLGVRQPLAKLFLKTKIEEKYFSLLEEEINVKEIIFDDKQNYLEGQKVILDLTLSPELKKEGEYRNLIRKIKDLRKALGLSLSEKVRLRARGSQESLDWLLSVKDELVRECQLSELKLELGEEEFILE